MAIDLDRCNGCGNCMVACSVENNVSSPPAEAGIPKATTWNRVHRAGNGKPFPEAREAFIPIPCQHCDTDPAPCASVCPQNAVERDPQSGIVAQIPVRCLGCRYCMVACPYHARTFNWWPPEFPHSEARALNPDVAPRMRGVVEKCNGCHGRLQAARERAALEGRDVEASDWQPACAEACPNGAIVFGDPTDKDGELHALVRGPRAFQLLAKLGTKPKVWYLSSHEWVRRLGDTIAERGNAGAARGTEGIADGR